MVDGRAYINVVCVIGKLAIISTVDSILMLSMSVCLVKITQLNRLLVLSTVDS